MLAKPVKIGVLGGIGPEATASFYLELITRLQSEGLVRDNTDFPQIIINSIPAPELVFGKMDEKDLNAYIKGLAELDSANPDFIIMVCNTIHICYDLLQGKIKTAILDIRAEMLNEIKNRNIKRVTVFGTPSTVTSGLYRLKGVEYLNPTKAELSVLSKAVFNFNKGHKKQLQEKIVSNLAHKHLQSGSELIILACTELAVLLKNAMIPKIDSLDVMVNAVVNRVMQLLQQDQGRKSG